MTRCGGLFSLFLLYILIHTSVKLVTDALLLVESMGEILIHTSVKLVTLRRFYSNTCPRILIHTSVKLVT